VLTVMDHGAVGGGTLVAASQLQAWRARGVDATSVSLAWTKAAMSEALGPEHHVELDRRWHIAKVWALRRVLATRSPSPHVVFAIGEFSGLVAVLARSLLSRARRPIIIVAEHQPALLEDVLTRGLPGLLARPIRRWIQTLRGRVDGWIGVTGEQLASRRAAGLVPLERSTVITNPLLVPGAPDEVLEARLRRRVTDRDAADARDAATVELITVGALNRAKNHALLLEAVARLDERFRLTIVGEGRERTALVDRAAQLGVADRVELAGSRQDVTDLLDGADLFVLSSDYESFGLVLIEAIARGLPIVATDCGPGVRSLAASCAAFSVVPVGDADALAGGIIAAMQQDLDLAMLRDDARRVAVTHDAEAAADAHLAFFRRVLRTLTRVEGR
jgi:glycosyltransferase involved in cell wall biosynthesis